MPGKKPPPAIVVDDYSDSAEDESKKCLCEEWILGATVMGCDFCPRWWHSACVGLGTMAKADIDGIKDWRCPFCIKVAPLVAKEVGPVHASVVETPKKDETPTNIDGIRAIFKEEVKALIPDVKKAIEESVELKLNAKSQSPLFSEMLMDNIEKTKTAIDTTLTQAVQKHQDAIVGGAMMRQDVDNIEREKRVRNIVIRNIPESKKEKEADKTKDDTAAVEYILDTYGEIENCSRAGRIPTESDIDPKTKKMKIRPLIVTMSTPELARRLHRYSMGRKFTVDGVEHWVNPDLIRSDRLANWEARKLKLQKKADRQNAVPKVATPPPVVVPKENSPVTVPEEPSLAPNTTSPHYKGHIRNQLEDFQKVYNSPEKKAMRAQEKAEREAEKEKERQEAIKTAAQLNTTGTEESSSSQQDFQTD